MGEFLHHVEKSLKAMGWPMLPERLNAAETIEKIAVRLNLDPALVSLGLAEEVEIQPVTRDSSTDALVSILTSLWVLQYRPQKKEVQEMMKWFRRAKPKLKAPPDFLPEEIRKKMEALGSEIEAIEQRHWLETILSLPSQKNRYPAPHWMALRIAVLMKDKGFVVKIGSRDRSKDRSLYIEIIEIAFLGFGIKGRNGEVADWERPAKSAISKINE